MLEAIIELVAAYPEVSLGVLVLLLLLRPIAGAMDWLFGQPRQQGGAFGETRETRVKRLYRQIAFGLVAAVAVYAAIQAGFV